MMKLCGACEVCEKFIKYLNKIEMILNEMMRKGVKKY